MRSPAREGSLSGLRLGLLRSLAFGLGLLLGTLGTERLMVASSPGRHQAGEMLRSAETALEALGKFSDHDRCSYRRTLRDLEKTFDPFRSDRLSSRRVVDREATVLELWRAYRWTTATDPATSQAPSVPARLGSGTLREVLDENRQRYHDFWLRLRLGGDLEIDPGSDPDRVLLTVSAGSDALRSGPSPTIRLTAGGRLLRFRGSRPEASADLGKDEVESLLRRLAARGLDHSEVPSPELRARTSELGGFFLASLAPERIVDPTTGIALDDACLLISIPRRSGDAGGFNELRALFAHPALEEIPPAPLETVPASSALLYRVSDDALAIQMGRTVERLTEPEGLPGIWSVLSPDRRKVLIDRAVLDLGRKTWTKLGSEDVELYRPAWVDNDSILFFRRPRKPSVSTELARYWLSADRQIGLPSLAGWWPEQTLPDHRVLLQGTNRPEDHVTGRPFALLDFRGSGNPLLRQLGPEVEPPVGIGSLDGSGGLRLRTSSVRASSDGTRIAAVGRITGLTWEPSRLWWARLDPETAETSAFRPLALHVEPESIAWSPDATRIAFRDRETISIVDLSGRIRRLMENGSSRPQDRRIQWSPDGRWLAFVAHHEIFVSSPEGEVRRIGRGWSPTWVPGST